MTEETNIDDRPISTMKISGQLAYFHQLTDQEIGEAMGSFTDGEIKILTLAARGLPPKEIYRQLSIKPRTLRYSLDHKQVFKDCYYSLASSNRPIGIEGVRSLAESYAVDSVVKIHSLTSGQADTASEKAVQLNANKEILTLAGAYKGTDTSGINIEKILILVHGEVERKSTWED